ncbi:MAG: hypothetical protein ACI83W_000337 [Marinoscillum sp.]
MSRSVIILGLLVGFLSLSIGGSYTIETADIAITDVSKTSEEQPEQEMMISNFDAITTSIGQFSFSHESILLEILPALDDQEETETIAQSTILYSDKVLKILFQRIISPNAP